MSDTAPAAERLPATIGDNLPPLVEQPADITTRLALNHPDLKTRADELLATFKTVPPTIENEHDAKQAADLALMMRALAGDTGEIEARRKVAQQPFDAALTAVRGWFAAIRGPVAEARVALDARLDAYQDKKLAAERLRLQREADAETERARLAQAKAQEAAARVRGPITAGKSALANLTASGQARQAEQAQARVAAPAGELVKTTTDAGATLSASTRMAYRNIDYAKIDLETLRPYIPRPAIEQAIRAFIKQTRGEQKLAGVEIFPETKARY